MTTTERDGALYPGAAVRTLREIRRPYGRVIAAGSTGTIVDGSGLDACYVRVRFEGWESRRWMDEPANIRREDVERCDG